ncbi:hypothetical protein ACWDR0_08245 [Streptomyces sp. NPDC003691]
MKKNRLAVGGAAAVFAAGIAIGAAAPAASAAPAAERIGSVGQLHEHLAKAVELAAQSGVVISSDPFGQKAPEAVEA